MRRLPNNLIVPVNAERFDLSGDTRASRPSGGRASRPSMDDLPKRGLSTSPHSPVPNQTSPHSPFAVNPIRLADKPLFDRAFAALKQPVSDLSFANAFMWAEALGATWAEIRGHLCVFANGADLTMLLPPLPLPHARGDDLAAVIDACFEIMDAYNVPRGGADRSRIEYVSDEMLERIHAAGVGLSASPLWADYVYDTERLIDLAGGDLKSKRGARSRFMREFPEHRAERLEPRHVPLCIELLDAWTTHGDSTHEGETNDAHLGTDLLRRKDQTATRRALEHADALGLVGMVVMVGDRLAGFTLGQALSPLQSVVLIEKTHPDFPGCPQFIFSEFCRRHLSGFPQCNVGDDWGIPSLRFTKQSYRPIRLLSKHVLSRQSTVTMSGLPMDTPANTRHRIHPPAPESQPQLAPAGIRRATDADADAIVEIEVESFDSPEELFTRRQIRRLIANPRAQVLVAEIDGRVVGWSVGLVRQHRSAKSGRLYAIAVRRSARGRQVGRSLAMEVQSAFASAGVARMYLEVRATNEPAIHLYRSLGFTLIKRLPAYYGLDASGRGIDGLRFRKVLT